MSGPAQAPPLTLANVVKAKSIYRQFASHVSQQMDQSTKQMAVAGSDEKLQARTRYLEELLELCSIGVALCDRLVPLLKAEESAQPAEGERLVPRSLG